MKSLSLTARKAAYTNLRRVHQLVEHVKYDGRKMRKFGFVKKEVGGKYRTMCIFISRKLGIILKYPAYLSKKRIISKHCIPSLFIRHPKKGEELAVFQPIAEMRSSTKIIDEFDTMKAEGKLDQWADVHEDNIGTFGGCPVLIDW